jgi:hypothetical protein
MPTRIEQLKQAGFSDGEIGDWATTERQRMREAGFTNSEIDDEFGVTRPPKEVPAAFIERLKQGNGFYRILGAAGEYAQRHFGDEPLGFSPENRDALGKLGVIGDIIVPAAKPVDAILRSIPAGIAGVGAGLGQMFEEGQQAALGPGPYAKGKAARDFAELAQIAALLSGTNGPKTRGMRAAVPNVPDGSIIALPRAEDFRNAAASIAGTPASFQTEQKLLRLWTEHGIPPIEAAQDAQRDQTIAKSIRSDSETVPEAYVRNDDKTMAPGARPDTSTQFLEANQADSAAVPVEGEAAAIKVEDRPPPNLNASEPAHMIAEGKDTYLYDPPWKRQRPFARDYDDYARTDGRGRLIDDIEGRRLGAKFIAGRRLYGEPDEPLSPQDIKDAMEQLDIRFSEVRPAMLPKNVLGLFVGSDSRHGPTGDIFVNNRSIQSEQDLVTAHEFSHAIDQFAGLLSQRLTTTDFNELRVVYGALRSGSEKKPYSTQPEHFGYRGRQIAAELVAEGIRAYLADPNYFKTMAPTTAAKIRAFVNDSPYLKKVIQFNSLGAAGLVGAGLRNQAGNDE